jgi:hypothetical protein
MNCKAYQWFIKRLLAETVLKTYFRLFNLNFLYSTFIGGPT